MPSMPYTFWDHHFGQLSIDSNTTRKDEVVRDNSESFDEFCRRDGQRKAELVRFVLVCKSIYRALIDLITSPRLQASRMRLLSESSTMAPEPALGLSGGGIQPLV